jgi:hypothetical protein
MTVYVLMADSDRTLRSTPWPTGKAVLDEDVAKAWVAEDPNWRVYWAVMVVVDVRD